MPIRTSIATNRITQAEFKDLAFEVMQHVFSIHNDFGCFFDERVYKHELASRMKDTVLEVPVDVCHGDFTKRYYADVLIHSCGLFEFKTAEALHPKHRTQTIHYLLLFDLPHGKLVNVRTEKVHHEFVNCGRRLAALRSPKIYDGGWDNSIAG